VASLLLSAVSSVAIDGAFFFLFFFLAPFFWLSIYSISEMSESMSIF
jgi:hypothetical protein